MNEMEGRGRKEEEREIRGREGKGSERELILR